MECLSELNGADQDVPAALLKAELLKLDLLQREYMGEKSIQSRDLMLAHSKTTQIAKETSIPGIHPRFEVLEAF